MVVICPYISHCGDMYSEYARAGTQAKRGGLVIESQHFKRRNCLHSGSTDAVLYNRIHATTFAMHGVYIWRAQNWGWHWFPPKF